MSNSFEKSVEKSVEKSCDTAEDEIPSNKIDVKTYNLSFFNVSSPVQTSCGHFSKILYNNADFNIQTPLCKVIEINVKTPKPYMIIAFGIASNFNHFQFFSNIYELSIEYLQKYIARHKLLENIVNTEENIRKAFVRTVTKQGDTEMHIRVKLNKSTLYFDKHQSEISELEIEVGDKVVCILKTQGISSDKNTSTQAWTGVQCLKFKSYKE